ncbi:hypothetical protein BXZ70DRAFT_742710 [Cristinia sonorae]|uniref:Uncharacterized protein n=1 Tax=Cristinia sonorae TaxID=1940300 RepID=A0A8K0UUI7_9AGAR|nr:hypothetical protein BXZ70DRAFT_742710 [Cristinia sonorae]
MLACFGLSYSGLIILCDSDGSLGECFVGACRCKGRQPGRAVPSEWEAETLWWTRSPFFGSHMCFSCFAGFFFINKMVGRRLSGFSSSLSISWTLLGVVIHNERATHQPDVGHNKAYSTPHQIPLAGRRILQETPHIRRPFRLQESIGQKYMDLAHAALVSIYLLVTDLAHPAVHCPADAVRLGAGVTPRFLALENPVPRTKRSLWNAQGTRIARRGVKHRKIRVQRASGVCRSHSWRRQGSGPEQLHSTAAVSLGIGRCLALPKTGFWCC